ncbi:MAG: ferrous iron transporter B [Oligoflexia bacterium]|nr:ferrous iron transporter B [Oligoflexia bacterium]
MHRVAIVGNMSVGKSTLFTKLCGMNVKNVNYPGTTVSVTLGHINKDEDRLIVDTPGTSSIFTHNEDERVSRDFFLSFDDIKKINIGIFAALLVADAKNLKRSLALAIQYAEYDVPMLLDINMVDEAESRGITIDYNLLSDILGIDVCYSVATEGKGIREIKSKLTSLRIPNKLIKYPPKIEEFIRITQKLLTNFHNVGHNVVHNVGHKISRGIIILLLAQDKSAEAYVAKIFGQDILQQIRGLREEYQRGENIPFEILITNLFYKKAEEIVSRVQSKERPSKNLYVEKFGRCCMQLSTGIPIAAIIIYLMYQFVGVFAATYVVDTLNNTFFTKTLYPICQKLVAFIPNAFVRDMIIDPNFGFVPTGIFLAFGLVLPVLFCFHIFFSILEDSGYLPRLSFLLDKVFHKIGLNGKGVMPIIMGFSCVTMAMLTTRVLDTKKEKQIATLLLLLGIPCAPLFGVMFVILGKMPITATLVFFAIIGFQILVAGYFANKILIGKRSPLLLEITPMRWPQPLQIIKKSLWKTYDFLKEAIPIFVMASIILFLIDRSGGLLLLEKVLDPITHGLLGLPQESVQVFIKAIIRRENGAIELRHLSESNGGGMYNNLQLVINMLVMTFLIPCLNTIIVVAKERGIKVTLLLLMIVTSWALISGGIVNHFCTLLGITFS